jgi:hypothetical protein
MSLRDGREVSSVILADEFPSRSDTTFELIPAAMSADAE